LQIGPSLSCTHPSMVSSVKTNESISSHKVSKLRWVLQILKSCRKYCSSSRVDLRSSFAETSQKARWYILEPVIQYFPSHSFVQLVVLPVTSLDYLKLHEPILRVQRPLNKFNRIVLSDSLWNFVELPENNTRFCKRFDNCNCKNERCKHIPKDFTCDEDYQWIFLNSL